MDLLMEMKVESIENLGKENMTVVSTYHHQFNCEYCGKKGMNEEETFKHFDVNGDCIKRSKIWRIA